MMNNISIAVVGLGSRGRAMLRLAASFPGVTVAAACDLQPKLWSESQRAGQQSIRDEFPNAKFYEDFTAMLTQADFNLLIVETPAHCHAEFCIAGLKAGKHVFSDIPTVRTLQEARDLWETQLHADTMLMVGANPNEWGFVEALYDFWKQGLLGKPTYLEAEYIHDVRHLWGVSPWRRTRMPILYCTHSLGPLLRVIEGDLRKVSCLSTGAQICGEANQHDLMTAHFHTEDSVVVRLTVSSINYAGCGLHSYRVMGTAGYFERLAERGKSPARCVLRSDKLYGFKQGAELVIDKPRPEYANTPGAQAGHGGADYALFDHFFSALRSGAEKAPIDLREGLRMTLPGIYAAESALRGGAELEIRYPWDPDFSTEI